MIFLWISGRFGHVFTLLRASPCQMRRFGQVIPTATSPDLAASPNVDFRRYKLTTLWLSCFWLVITHHWIVITYFKLVFLIWLSVLLLFCCCTNTLFTSLHPAKETLLAKAYTTWVYYSSSKTPPTCKEHPFKSFCWRVSLVSSCIYDYLWAYGAVLLGASAFIAVKIGSNGKE